MDNQTPTILVVDDEKDAREMLDRWLRRSGYDVALAAAGWEALLKLDERRIDLILLDMMMPGLDGGTFLKILRGTARKQATPVMIVTAMERPEAEKALGDSRVEGVIVKNQEFLEDLSDKLRDVFGEKPGVNPLES